MTCTGDRRFVLYPGELAYMNITSYYSTDNTMGGWVGGRGTLIYKTSEKTTYMLWFKLNFGTSLIFFFCLRFVSLIRDKKKQNSNFINQRKI